MLLQVMQIIFFWFSFAEYPPDKILILSAAPVILLL